MNLKELQQYGLTDYGIGYFLNNVKKNKNAKIISVIFLNSINSNKIEDEKVTNLEELIFLILYRDDSGIFAREHLIAEKQIDLIIKSDIKNNEEMEILNIKETDYTPFKKENVIELLKSENSFLRTIVNNFSKK